MVYAAPHKGRGPGLHGGARAWPFGPRLPAHAERVEFLASVGAELVGPVGLLSSSDVAIDSACRMLRLPSIRNEFSGIADRAIKDQMTYRSFLAEREEKNSVAIASNESFGGWTKTFDGQSPRRAAGRPVSACESTCTPEYS